MGATGKSDQDELTALLLFEELAEHDEHSGDENVRGRLIEAAPPRVRAILSELSAAADRAAGRFTKGFPEDTAQTQPRPARIGVYRLASPIGTGGMGEVWRATRDDGLFEQVVAIKLIRAGIMGALAADRFAEERRMLARLDHPGIARIMDGGIAEGWPYLVMEYVKGVPIGEWCDVQRPDLRARVDLIVQAAAAVRAAHAGLIAHADIKPENLLVTETGTVKLIDFGIAERMGTSDAVGPRPMTRQFASPERLAGAGPSVADDVFALGRVLTSIAPAEACDADLRAIADKACAPAAKRYDSAEQLCEDLFRWQALRPVTARRATVGHQARLFLRRNGRWTSMMAAGLLLIGTACAFAIADHRAAGQARLAESQRVRELLAVNRYILFELDGRLSHMSHSLALRAALAERSQVYLDRLGALPDANPATRIGAAEGWRRLAAIQDRPGQASLGRPQAALASLDRGVTLLAGLMGVDADRAYAANRLDVARVRMYAFTDPTGAAHVLADAGLRLRRLGGAAGRLTGESLLIEAEIASWQSRFADEVRLGRAGLTAPASGDPRDDALQRIGVLSELGEGLFYGESVAPSLPIYARERREAETAEARWPGDPTVMQAAAHAGWDLGSSLLEAGRADEALAILNRAALEIGTLTSFDTQDDEAARLRNIIEDNRAQTLAKLGRKQEAAALYDAGVERWAQAWRRAPTPMRLRDYAIALEVDGTVHAGNGDIAQACRVFDQARRQFDILRAQHALPAFDEQQSVRPNSEHLARYCTRAPG
jgi:tetratricopeptide (TPR) repeat protein